MQRIINKKIRCVKTWCVWRHLRWAPSAVETKGCSLEQPFSTPYPVISLFYHQDGGVVTSIQKVYTQYSSTPFFIYSYAFSLAVVAINEFWAYLHFKLVSHDPLLLKVSNKQKVNTKIGEFGTLVAADYQVNAIVYVVLSTCTLPRTM